MSAPQKMSYPFYDDTVVIQAKGKKFTPCAWWTVAGRAEGQPERLEASRAICGDNGVGAVVERGGEVGAKS